MKLINVDFVIPITGFTTAEEAKKFIVKLERGDTIDPKRVPPNTILINCEAPNCPLPIEAISEITVVDNWGFQTITEVCGYIIAIADLGLEVVINDGTDKFIDLYESQ